MEKRSSSDQSVVSVPMEIYHEIYYRKVVNKYNIFSLYILLI